MELLSNLLRETWPDKQHHEGQLTWGCIIFDNVMRVVVGECIETTKQERRLLLYVCVLRLYDADWPLPSSPELIALNEKLKTDLGGEEYQGIFEFVRTSWKKSNAEYPSHRVRLLCELIDDGYSLQMIGSAGLNTLIQDLDSTAEERVQFIQDTLLSLPSRLYTETAYKLGCAGLTVLNDYIEDHARLN